MTDETDLLYTMIILLRCVRGAIELIRYSRSPSIICWACQQLTYKKGSYEDH